jgi:hypothetical protein
LVWQWILGLHNFQSMITKLTDNNNN